MMGSKREEERNEKIIRGLMKLPPNRRCINCNSLVILSNSLSLLPIFVFLQRLNLFSKLFLWVYQLSFELMGFSFCDYDFYNLVKDMFFLGGLCLSRKCFDLCPSMGSISEVNLQSQVICLFPDIEMEREARKATIFRSFVWIWI